MAGYGGYFLKGFAGGLQSGINMGQQIIEMKWQKAQKKKLQERQDKLIEAGNIFNAKVKEFGADNIYSGDEINQLTTIYLSSGYEFQEHYGNAMNYISGMKDKEFNQELEWMDSFIEMTTGLSPDSISDIYDNFEGQFITSEKGKTLFAANKRIQEKKYEIAQAQPTTELFPTAEAVQAKYPNAGYRYDSAAKAYVPVFKETEEPDLLEAVKYLRRFPNVTSEQFNNLRIDAERHFNMDLSIYTQDMLKEVGDELSNLYNTPEEVMSNIKAPEGLTVIPKRDTKTGKYYASFQKKTTGAPLLVKVVDPNDVLFGTHGIMKDYISSGSQLGDEQKTEIRNNYELIKPSLDEKTQKQIEEYLRQIGIDVSVPVAGEVIETPPPKKGVKEKISEWWHGTPPPVETSDMKVSPSSKEAMIPLMTKEELHKAMSDTDKSDPLWNLLYAEAVKRGYITE